MNELASVCPAVGIPEQLTLRSQEVRVYRNGCLDLAQAR